MKFLIFLLLSGTILAQNDSLNKAKDSAVTMNNTIIRDSISAPAPFKLKAKQFIIPGVLITYGALATATEQFKKINFDTRNEIREDHPTFRTTIDNYTQFLPGATVFALQAFGIKGESSVKKELIVYAMSIGISTAIVIPTKKLTHQERPDGSNNQSFPSGHTALAFASAEFLRREYWNVSPWIGVAGYAVAAGTGILRMYNNKHWLGDVAAGAGIGILSTTLSYWLYDKIWTGENHKHQVFLFPGYNNKQFTIGLVKQF
ncbi:MULTISPECIES: phosphatase PAP2 family protein [unclassified Chryseobacterium]|uniref:phosphatase PAP2 family protein n=1 Tax=unclassified Chryseobacterium TaxID=2593645 RepID=UPI001AE5BAC5|nr:MULTISPECIES: phosphatase PAP2 family protein [unclassified Chryseobacterium]MBP1164488.1 membrane-associated phospholipid phosphatase [Chryseobacterium sp. PvR013]MDR4890643.1 phosphatase PAP2 family protein [Chryseobacterium sp. CFS7]